MDYRLQDKEGIRYLNSSDSATQSAIDLNNPHKIILKNLEYAMGCLMFMQTPKNILLLGVAGGSLIHFFRHHLPSSHITGIDYDEALLKDMQSEFLLPKADKNLTYIIADAQTWIKQNDSQFDLIVVDLFNEQAMPEWVLNKDFMLDIKQHLNQGGCVSWNTLISSDHAFTQFYNALRLVFNKHTLCLAADDYENTIAYSFNYELEDASMGHLFQLAQQQSEQYDIPFLEILNVIFNTNPIDSGFI